LNGVDNFKHPLWPESFWPRAKQSVFLRCCHAVFHGLDAVLPLIRQLENKIAIGHPVPLSKRLAEVGNEIVLFVGLPCGSGSLNFARREKI
jgi:hypothetical protein